MSIASTKPTTKLTVKLKRTSSRKQQMEIKCVFGVAFLTAFVFCVRIRKADRDSARLARQEALELRHMLLLSRRRLMRQLREKRLASIALLPAGG